MGLAVEPPVRVDLAFRDTDDQPVSVLYLRADMTTPIAVTSAVVTMRFDLPDDDTWPLDPDGVPIEPARQTHTISGGAPGDAGGWVVDDGFADGQILFVVPHTMWATILEPWSGRWDLVAVTVDSLRRQLARGEFVCEAWEEP
jgi:hypothetical protein